SLNGGRRWSPSQRTTTTSFGIPDLHPNQDTGAPDCFFGDRLDLQPNGGGFLATWTGGMDPDIFFAPVRTYTTLTLSIKPGVGRITATGTLDPAVVGGKVTATLFRKSGNRFLKV